MTKVDPIELARSIKRKAEVASTLNDKNCPICGQVMKAAYSMNVPVSTCLSCRVVLPKLKDSNGNHTN